METKIVKVTDKGQISLPIKFREHANIKKGDSLLMIRKGKTIILKEIEESKFKDLLKHSESVAKKLWDNKEDEVWNNV